MIDVATTNERIDVNKQTHKGYSVTFAAAAAFDGTPQTRVDMVDKTRLPRNGHVGHFGNATHLMITQRNIVISIVIISIIDRDSRCSPFCSYGIVEGQNGVKHLPFSEMTRLIKHSVSPCISVGAFKAHSRANAVQIEVISQQKKRNLQGQ